MRVIEHIEELRSKVERNFLGNTERARHCQIEVGYSRTIQHVRGRITERKRCGNTECRGVKPEVRAALAPREVTIAQAVRALSTGRVCRISVHARCHRQSLLD